MTTQKPQFYSSEPTKVFTTLEQFTPVIFPLARASVGFGGPIALGGTCRHDLVDCRRFGILKEDYPEGLALAPLAPGPLAASARIYPRL